MPDDKALTTARDEERERVELIKRTIADKADLTDLELQLFLHVCRKTQLDPLLAQIYALKSKKTGKLSFVIGIDGFRAIAGRSGDYVGQPSSRWAGTDLVWRKAWIESGPPAVARCGVRRRGFERPLFETATWRSYGRDEAVWRQYPDVMLAKVAEARAIRKAFPAELSGLYAREELFDESLPQTSPVASELDERARAKRAKATLEAIVQRRGQEWCRLQTEGLDRSQTVDALEALAMRLKAADEKEG